MSAATYGMPRCLRCKEVLPENAPVIADLEGERLCERCNEVYLTIMRAVDKKQPPLDDRAKSLRLVRRLNDTAEADRKLREDANAFVNAFMNGFFCFLAGVVVTLLLLEWLR